MLIIQRFLLAILLLLPAAAEAGGWSSILEVLFSRGGKTAAEITIEDGVRSSGRFARTILDQSATGSLKGREAKQLDDIVSRMMAASPPEKIASRLDALKTALAQARAGTNELTHTASFDEGLPFIRIRATGNPILDDALSAFARAKFNPMLAERFSVDDLRVIPLGMSEDVDFSAKEIARYNRWLPSAQQDGVGPLAQFAKGDVGQISKERLAQMLVPYRGKTIVLVGHVPEDTQAFFVTTAEGMKPVDLSAWMEAADAADVNIIPVGCNSGRFSPIGAAHDINSDDVLQRVLNVINRRPSTISDFFRELSGNDLVLVLDPTRLNIFNNTIEIVQKETQEHVGRIITNTSRETFREGVRFTSRTPSPNYDACFQEKDKEGFAACSIKAEVDFKEF